MDWRRRFLDIIFIERLWRSLQSERVYLHAFAGGGDTRWGIEAWISFYNGRQPW
jgi:putative transposase